MFSQINPNEMPGLGTSIVNLNRAAWLNRQGVQYLPGGGRIDGNNARDPSNASAYWEAGTYAAALPPNQASASAGVGPYAGILQAGLLMGVISTPSADLAYSGTTSNLLYGASIYGLTGAAITGSSTGTMQVPAAVGAEILRRVGATGTLLVIGPASTGATQTINVQTLTLTSITHNSAVYWTLNFTPPTDSYVIGSLLAASDGSGYPVTLVDEEDGIRVTDAAGASIAAVQFPRVPVGGGVLNVASLINYSSGAAVTATTATTQTTEPACQTWLRSMLNMPGRPAPAAAASSPSATPIRTDPRRDNAPHKESLRQFGTGSLATCRLATATAEAE